MNISFDGIDQKVMKLRTKTVLTSNDLEADNTFENPTKVFVLHFTFRLKIKVCSKFCSWTSHYINLPKNGSKSLRGFDKNNID